MSMSQDTTSYEFTSEEAGDLAGAVGLPRELRSMILKKYGAERGVEALADLFSRFIGMANSVVANNREMVEFLLLTEGHLHPHQAEQVNLPTLFGALMGARLAAGVDPGKTCGGCAFRLGTIANQSPSTTGDGDWCSHLGEAEFWCHEELGPGGEPRKACAGFAQVRKARLRAGAS